VVGGRWVGGGGGGGGGAGGGGGEGCGGQGEGGGGGGGWGWVGEGGGGCVWGGVLVGGGGCGGGGGGGGGGVVLWGWVGGKRGGVGGVGVVVGGWGGGVGCGGGEGVKGEGLTIGSKKHTKHFILLLIPRDTTTLEKKAQSPFVCKRGNVPPPTSPNSARIHSSQHMETDTLQESRGTLGAGEKGKIQKYPERSKAGGGADKRPPLGVGGSFSRNPVGVLDKTARGKVHGGGGRRGLGGLTESPAVQKKRPKIHWLIERATIYLGSSFYTEK